MALHKVFLHSFESIYNLYLQKIQKKQRTESELLMVLEWLTGYAPSNIEQIINDNWTLEKFINEAYFHPDAHLIKGSICGVKIESIEDPMMLKVRYMDKLVDDLAKGKSVEQIIFL